MSDVVRLISGGTQLVLDACNGQRTIAQASDVFSYISPDFKSWGTDVAGRATPKTPVTVHEVVEDANFAKMFGALADNYSKLVLEQHQIVNFVEKYRDWLCQDGLATFFLFQSGSELFVAFVRCYSGGHLEVYLCPLEYSRVWLADVRRRLVVPQL